MRCFAPSCLPVLALFLLLAGCRDTDPANLMHAAQAARNTGDIRSAVIQLKNVLQQDSKHRAARIMLGELYLEQGDPQAAENELGRARALGADASDVTLLYARALLRQGKYAQLLADIGEDAAPGARPALLAARASALLGQQQTHAARALFDQAAALAPDAPEPLLGLAHLALRERQPAQAGLLVRRVLAQHPGHVDALRLQADLLRAEGKLEDALASQQAILRQHPHNLQALLDKANLHTDAGHIEAAHAALAAARKVGGASLALLSAEAMLDYRQHKLDSALDKVQRVLRAAPEHAPSLLLAGAIQSARGARDEARGLLQRFLAAHPRHLHASKLLAALELQAERPAEALALLRLLIDEYPADVDLLALAGEASLRSGRFADAAAHFARASELSPNNAPLRTGLALGYMGSGEHARALAELEHAARLDTDPSRTGVLLALHYIKDRQPDKAMATVQAMQERGHSALLHNLKGGIYLSQQQMARARASFEQALKLEPAYLPALRNLAQLDALERKTADTARRYQAALARTPGNTDLMEALAAIALDQQRHAEAISWMERATAAQPASLPLALRHVGVLLQAGERKRALDMAARLQAAHPANAQALALLAHANSANGQFDQAADVYTRLAASAPRSPSPWLELGHVHIAQRRLPQAAQALRKALQLAPDLLDARITLVNLLLRQRAYDEALALAVAEQQRAPATPAGYKLAGDVHAARGQHGTAVAAYERAFKLGASGPALVQLYGALLAQGREAAADARMAEWFKVQPGDVATRLHFASSKLVRGDLRQAIVQFEAVLRLDPRNVAALNDLAWSYHGTGNGKALPTALRAHAIAPGNPSVMDTLGWIYVEQGQLARALPLLRQAAAAAPNAGEIHYHLGVALARSGDQAGARRALEQALAVPSGFAQRELAMTLLATLAPVARSGIGGSDPNDRPPLTARSAPVR